MQKNVTLTLEEDVLMKAKHMAVEQKKSLSRLLSDFIRGLVEKDSELEKDRKIALKYLKKGFYLDKHLSRKEIYELPRHLR
jgi:hypothetical protein